MGKGTIISGGTDGQYQVEVLYNLERAAAEKAANLAKIANLEAQIAAETDEQKLNILKLQKLSLEKRNETLDAIPETKEITAWCADLTEDLTGDVGLIEVPGESVAFNVQPGYENNAVYDPARDGQLTPTLAMTPAQAFYNLAMLPGWQKWKPTYRYGTITAISGDTADVTLDAATSTQQSLGVNQESTLTGVPIEYMSCNGAAFEVGDEVLVKFTGQDWGGPVVVGFKDNPKACALTFLFIALDGDIAKVYPETLQLIDRWEIVSGGLYIIKMEYGFDGYLYALSRENISPGDNAFRIHKINTDTGKLIKTAILISGGSIVTSFMQNPFNMCLYVGAKYLDGAGVYKINPETLNVEAQRVRSDRPAPPPDGEIGIRYMEDVEDITFNDTGDEVYLCGLLEYIREENSGETPYGQYATIAVALDADLGENMSRRIVPDGGRVARASGIKFSRDGDIYIEAGLRASKLTQSLSLIQESDPYASGTVFNYNMGYSWDGKFYVDNSNDKITEIDFPHTTVYDIGRRMLSPRDGGDGNLYSNDSDYYLTKMKKSDHSWRRYAWFGSKVRCIAFNWPIHVESMNPGQLVNGISAREYLPKDRTHPSDPGGEDN
jgi:hypothetical protein